MPEFPTRRRLVAVLAGALLLPGRLRASLVSTFESGSDHPDPRPGVDARDVISADKLKADGFDDSVVEVFDMVRQIPQVADGLACYCGCMLLGSRSLLTCYYEGAMARSCQVCQGEGRLAYRRWKEGQTLDQIRRAIDARFNR